MTSPTERTLALCRKHGWTCATVERWNAFAKIRQDLFGFIDIVALNGTSIVGIQTTSGSNVSARIQKIRANPKSLEWVECGGRLLVHGWRKLRSSGKWECREVEITRDMLQDERGEAL